MTDLPTLVERPVLGSIDELLAGAQSREPIRTGDSKSGASFERVVIDGERFVVKHLHVDDDWIMRAGGDIRCRPLLVFKSGLMDAMPATIDHTVVAVAGGLGRNGWGSALLMHDVAAHLVPEGDTPISLDQQLGFMDHMASVHARFWGWRDTVGLTPYANRWAWFSPGMIAVEQARGFPDPVPSIVRDGWERFAVRVDPDLASKVTELRDDLDPLTSALASTPSTFLHGDWKMGNLGSHTDGRTILLDWAAPGEGPAISELLWYLAINAARLPQSKEATIAAYRAALVGHGIDMSAWWDKQLGLALLGALVQFGWEKALGTEDELSWWVDGARSGLEWV